MAGHRLGLLLLVAHVAHNGLGQDQRQDGVQLRTERDRRSLAEAKGCVPPVQPLYAEVADYLVLGDGGGLGVVEDHDLDGELQLQDRGEGRWRDNHFVAHRGRRQGLEEGQDVDGEVGTKASGLPEQLEALLESWPDFGSGGWSRGPRVLGKRTPEGKPSRTPPPMQHRTWSRRSRGSAWGCVSEADAHALATMLAMVKDLLLQARPQAAAMNKATKAYTGSGAAHVDNMAVALAHLPRSAAAAEAAGMAAVEKPGLPRTKSLLLTLR